MRNVPLETLMYEATGQAMPPQVGITLKRDDAGDWVLRCGAVVLGMYRDWRTALRAASEYGVTRVGDAGVMSE